MTADHVLISPDLRSPLHDLKDLPPRAIVIHGGMYKTGSSSLQNAMALNRDALLDAGWLYPQAGLIEQDDIGRRHKKLMAEVRDGAAGPSWERLRSEVDRWPGRVFISHENFFSPHVDPSRVAARLHDREVFLLAYLRHPADYLESCYREWVRRWGYAGSLRAFYQWRRGYFDVPALLSAWNTAIGSERVLLRAYDRDRMVAGSTLADVMALMGIHGIQPVGGQNETLNARQTLVHLLANRLGLPAGAGLRHGLSKALASAEASREALAALPKAPASGVNARKLLALRKLLKAPADHPARVMDDELFDEVERRWLPGFQAALAAHGAPPGALTRSTYAAARRDRMFDDRSFCATVELLLS